MKTYIVIKSPVILNILIFWFVKYIISEPIIVCEDNEDVILYNNNKFSIKIIFSF